LKTHLGESFFKTLEPEFGFRRPTKKLSMIYNILSLASIIFFTYLFGLSNEGSIIFGIMIGIIVWVGIWYLDAMWSGLTSPKSAKIKT